MLLCHFKLLGDLCRADEMPPFLWEVSARNIADGVEIATPNRWKIALCIHQEEWGTQEAVLPDRWKLMVWDGNKFRRREELGAVDCPKVNWQLFCTCYALFLLKIQVKCTFNVPDTEAEGIKCAGYLRHTILFRTFLCQVPTASKRAEKQTPGFYKVSKSQ